MNLGLRGRLFVISLVLIVVTGLASTFYLESRLRFRLVTRIESELFGYAQLTREAIEAIPGRRGLARIDDVADRLGAASGARVSIIRADGRVIGDSELDLAEVDRTESHSNRPEVIAAHAGGRGTSRRYSKTLGTDMLYVAVPYDGPVGSGVARVAMPLSEVDRAVGGLRVLLVLAGLLGLVVAVFMSGLASFLTTRALRRMVDTARALARGEGRPLRISSSDEIGKLAGSINRMSEELEDSVGQLAQERDRFETVLQSMTEAVLAVDADHRISLANNAAREYLGTEGTPKGRLLFEVIRAPELEGLFSSDDEAPPVATEFDWPGTPPRRVLARIAPLRAAGGHVLVMHDVTERRRLETVRRDFVANVSHELRTPVSVILANAETLLDGALDERKEAAQFVKAIHGNAERLTQLIADLLDLSRIEAGGYAIQVGPVRLDEILQSVVEPVRRTALGKQQSIELDAAEELAVQADPKALEQILLNLLDNAVKYTPQGGRITVRATSVPEGARLEVADDGPGIEPRHRERIFERFYRIDPGRSREMGGTGLGLSIVRNLAESMRGRVGMDPATPRGSIFWVVLPAGTSTPFRPGN